MNRERLELLVKRLNLEQSRVDPLEHFNMKSWVSHLRSIVDGAYQPECGTTVCAAGLATTVPKLRAAGLHFDQDGNLRLMGQGDERQTTFLLACFFGINWDTADNLFSPSSYDSIPDTEPGEVADRIRELLARETP